MAGASVLVDRVGGSEGGRELVGWRPTDGIEWCCLEDEEEEEGVVVVLSPPFKGGWWVCVNGMQGLGLSGQRDGVIDDREGSVLPAASLRCLGVGPVAYPLFLCEGPAALEEG